MDWTHLKVYTSVIGRFNECFKLYPINVNTRCQCLKFCLHFCTEEGQRHIVHLYTQVLKIFLRFQLSILSSLTLGVSLEYLKRKQNSYLEMLYWAVFELKSPLCILLTTLWCLILSGEGINVYITATNYKQVLFGHVHTSISPKHKSVIYANKVWTPLCILVPSIFFPQYIPFIKARKN